MRLAIKKGTTSRIVTVFIADATSLTGGGLTGLAYNTSGLAAYYQREGEAGAAATAISLVTCTLGAFTSGGFKEVSAANMPGVYELHIPNAALATGATGVTILLQGAANMVPVVLHVQLTAFDLDTANVSIDLSQVNTTETAKTTVGGQLRRTHALIGGNKATQDHSAANAPIKHRNEADSGDLVTLTETVAGAVSTITPT